MCLVESRCIELIYSSDHGSREHTGPAVFTAPTESPREQRLGKIIEERACLLFGINGSRESDALRQSAV